MYYQLHTREFYYDYAGMRNAQYLYLEVTAVKSEVEIVKLSL
jgi:hypothetical protein